MPAAATTPDPDLGKEEFAWFRKVLHQETGICLQPEKADLVRARLYGRVQALGMASYKAYLQALTAPGGEAQAERARAFELMTTNETSFFREERHFEFLRDVAVGLNLRGQAVRVWSAACSTGEEPYSIAMTLAEAIGLHDGKFEVLATDLSDRVLAQAQAGQYALERARGLSHARLSQHCLRGVRTKEGNFLIRREIRERVTFRQLNLSRELAGVGEFDVIFLRNVLIYFDLTTRQQVSMRLGARLREGGYLITGHSETLDERWGFTLCMPTVYQRARGAN